MPVSQNTSESSGSNTIDVTQCEISAESPVCPSPTHSTPPSVLPHKPSPETPATNMSAVGLAARYTTPPLAELLPLRLPVASTHGDGVSTLPPAPASGLSAP